MEHFALSAHTHVQHIHAVRKCFAQFYALIDHTVACHRCAAVHHLAQHVCHLEGQAFISFAHQRTAYGEAACVRVRHQPHFGVAYHSHTHTCCCGVGYLHHYRVDGNIRTPAVAHHN